MCNEVFVAQEVIPAKGHSFTMNQTLYELTAGTSAPLADIAVSCEHVSAITLSSTSSNEAIAVLEDNVLQANGIGTATIDIAATLPDGFGAHITITVIVHSPDKAILPDSLITIAEEAFINTAVAEYVLPNGCTTIGAHAFAGSQVKMIVIPASVTNIASDAFEGCTLTIVTTAGSTAEAFAQNHGIAVVLH